MLGWIRAWLTDRKQRVVLNGNVSLWAAVLSGVPQGSVLGPLLFLIFINDLDLSAVSVSIISKFADDTKLGQLIRNERDRENLQRALDELVKWSEVWGMEFNVEKCKVMHIGHNNPEWSYNMNGTQLVPTEQEKDLGVIMNRKLKPGAQCAKAARTAQTVLSQITRAFHFRDKTTFLQLYKTYVRPHLEFSAQAWSPWQEGDKEVLEKIQRRAINQISGLRSESYEEKCKELGITTLEERRHRGDMAMMYRIITEKDDVDPSIWFSQAADGARNTRTTSDLLNVRVKHGRLDIRKNFFSVRVTEPWNKIPSKIKSLSTMGGFKSAYAKYRQAV